MSAIINCCRILFAPPHRLIKGLVLCDAGKCCAAGKDREVWTLTTTQDVLHPGASQHSVCSSLRWGRALHKVTVTYKVGCDTNIPAVSRALSEGCNRRHLYNDISSSLKMIRGSFTRHHTNLDTNSCSFYTGKASLLLIVIDVLVCTGVCTGVRSLRQSV